ncbi:MAG: alpha/beta hydrolase [Caulobacteraceae bacterium]
MATIRDSVELHYIEAGIGAPVVFVHGSLSDYGYWEAQVRAFAEKYRAIAYSRRYDWPNDNRRGAATPPPSTPRTWPGSSTG